MRSRTGCLTCRARKLKCDEKYQIVGDKQNPQCTQCRKASRECRPSEGIVFRHQQNASMNYKSNDDDSGCQALGGFYSYKNTFDEDAVWLDIPKNVIFVDNTDPHVDELEASLLATDFSRSETLVSEWNHWHSFTGSNDTADDLTALSSTKAKNQYTFQHSSTARVDSSIMTHTTYSDPRGTPNSKTTHSPSNTGNALLSPASPPMSIASSNNNNNNINFLLNPSNAISPPLESSLSTAVHRSDSSSYAPGGRRSVLSDEQLDAKIETDHEIAFLLRHFAENPGYWMDLFDLDCYFSSLVPIKALSNPLLKYAACAYAGKQLSRVKGAKAVMGGRCSKQASMEVWPDAEKVNWEWYGANYYDKAIQLLVKELQRDAKGPALLSTPEAFGQWQAAELYDGGERARKRRRRCSNSRFSGSHSDEVLAATAILSVYEFLDATGPAWNRHLSGVKSLLDIAEIGMMPLEPVQSPGDGMLPRKSPGLSRSRRATFWNFARQDCIAAFINECQTRLNPEDLLVWTEAGLQLDSNGFVCPSNTDEESHMKEDMISNALIWLMSKIVNFIGAGDQIHVASTGGQSEQGPIGPIGVSQNTLLERWYRLQSELDAWYNGLPETFQPCARLKSPRGPPHTADGADDCPFDELWYSMPMCASTMQHYHMARIILLINKPHESTARRTTVTNRLKSYRSIESEIRLHSYEICNISMSRLDASCRIHSVQPLFVTGQCLTEPRERRTILGLLRGIEADTGWATEYRVKQLLEDWEWEEEGTRS